MYVIRNLQLWSTCYNVGLLIFSNLPVQPWIRQCLEKHNHTIEAEDERYTFRK